MNKNLHAAKRNKMDEFYTQLTDIEEELRHYRSYFKNKIVLCNCDDPGVSNFYFYFSRNFKMLKLKKLITTCYKNDQFDLFSRNDKAQAVCHEYIETDKIKEENEWLLKGDGDFRSEECIELLKQIDIVCTNPPFSLFREYVTQLIEYKKKFLIVGHQNAIAYKEIFPLIKDNKIWLGYGFKGGAAHFISPHYEDYASAGDHKEGMIRISGVHWFTNLPHKKRNEELILTKKYKGNEKEYSKYDNYDAIEVSTTKDIPRDYNGVMGVPITFLDKYNPEQFEILGQMANTKIDEFNFGYPFVNGERKYARILIKRRQN
jgi:hypothetical protein